MKEIRSETAVERSCTAGADAGGQQAGGVVLESERDRNTYRWLLENYGEDAIKRAIAGLSGARKPYVSNIVKALGATVPFRVEHPVSDDARAALRAVREKLAAKNPQ